MVKVKVEPLEEKREECDEVSEVETDCIQAPKVDKRKQPRTQAQKDAFEKVIEKRTIKRDERKIDRELVMKERKVLIDEKIVKKALLAIKKIQIIQEAVLDDISDDDDIPIEVVKKIQQKYVKKKTLPPIARKSVVYEKVQEAPQKHISYTFI